MVNDVLSLECDAISLLDFITHYTSTHSFQIGDNILNNFMAPIGGTNYKIKTKNLNLLRGKNVFSVTLTLPPISEQEETPRRANNE